VTLEKPEIKYIGFYSLHELEFERRACNLAAMNKMDYICSAINRAGYSVNIVSPSWSANKSGLYRGRKIGVNENKTITLCPTFGAHNKILRALCVIYSLCWLFIYLLLHVKRNEKVLAYHSLWLSIRSNSRLSSIAAWQFQWVWVFWYNP
jgi:hypothetical protein